MADFTTDLDSDSASGDYVGQRTSSGEGSFAQIRVPNHGTSTFYYTDNSARTMTSFLRIGAVPDNDPTKEDGWELAQLVVAFNDDLRKRPVDEVAAAKNKTVSEVVAGQIENATTTDLTTDPATGVVTDSSTDTLLIPADVQQQMADFYGSGDLQVTADQQQRITESMKLHFRGGWRDHSDGNRISTTRGDKVEIVRGNYKMVVLGRRPDAAGDETLDRVGRPVDTLANSVTSWDASGGHILDWRFTPGAWTDISWVQDDEYGTWKVTEETVKGDVDSTFYGTVTETFLGRSITTTIGWPGGCATDNFERAEGDADDESIPKLLRDNPGLKRENSTVTERTWAKEIFDYDGSADCPVDYIEEKTYAKEMREEIHVTAGKGKITRETRAKELREEFHTPSHVSYHYGVDAREMWQGHFGELFLGASETLKIGNFVDVRVGAKIIETNVSFPGALTHINIAPVIVTAEFGHSKVDLFAGPEKLNIVLADDIEFVGGQKLEASVDYKRLAIAIFLG
jgi:hypothetical protein